ncbi:MAG: ABC transporter substrate-binding protein, partial [Alphaproteobacteria bacterium]
LARTTHGYLTRAVLVDGFFLRSSNPAVRPFASRFKEDYGHDPSFLAAVGFDTARLLGKIIALPAVTNREKLRFELLNLHDYAGVTGELSVGEDRNVHRRLYLLRIGETQIEEMY